MSPLRIKDADALPAVIVASQTTMRTIAVWVLLTALMCVSSLLCMSAPALAGGHAEDAAATRAYLGASEFYARGAFTESPASTAAVEARARSIAKECPSSLTYAPRDEAFEELTEATEMTVVYAGVAPVRSATLRLANVIAHLRWSNSKLTRLVRSQAVGERLIAALALPDVCADIDGWRMSTYTRLPSSVTEFMARVLAIEGEPSEESRETVILHLLKPYEGRAERRTVARIEQLEVRNGRRLATAIALARRKLASALGVSAL